MGNPDLVKNGAFITASAQLYAMRDPEKPAFTAKSRIATMQKAQDLCDTLRDSFGNCVISRLDLRLGALWPTDLERLPPGTNPLRLHATAVIKIYADKSQTNRDGLRQIVQSLTAAD